MRRIATVFMLLFAVPGIAAASADAGKEQARKMQQMQRKFAQDKAALEVQLREANDKFAASDKKAEEASAKSAALGGKLRKLEEENHKLTAGLEESRQQAAEQGRKLGAERDGLRAELARQKESNNTCEARSAKLYQYGDELLKAYVDKGTLTGALQNEPFTGIKRIEVENVAEDYRDKLDSVKPPSTAKGG